MTDDAGMPGGDAPATITGRRRVALGCFTAILGCASGSMIAVLLSSAVAYLARAPKCPDIPTCDWYVYAGIGALLGGISLPAMVLWRISRPRRTN